MFTFKKQQRRVDLQKLIRRLVDQTTPNLSGDRQSKRYNRTIPVLLVPIEKRSPLFSRSTYALTKDVCDDGIGLILPCVWEDPDVIVGFWHATKHLPPWSTEPSFAVGTVRMNVEIGGGFWQLGIQFTDMFADPDYVRFLRPLAEPLVPAALMQPDTESSEAVPALS